MESAIINIYRPRGSHQPQIVVDGVKVTHMVMMMLIVVSHIRLSRKISKLDPKQVMIVVKEASTPEV